MKEKYFFANRPIEAATKYTHHDILKARERGYPLPEDPNAAVNRSLDAFGLEIYPSPIPPIDQYISARVNHSDDAFPGYNYGTFVKMADETIAFAKLRYGPKNTEKALVEGELVDVRVGGLRREADVLKALAEKGYEVPAFYGYSQATPTELDPEPDTAETLETLFMEAIPPEEGSTKPPDLWTTELARLAARKIKTFAKPISEFEIFKNEQTPLPVDILLQRARLEDGAYESALADLIENYKYLYQPIVVHGDTWPNNIIVKNDNSELMFVDWELASPGYKSQDAGRTVWGLTIDREWNLADINELAHSFIDEWVESEDDKQTLAFGVMFESLRWIADRQDRINSQDADDMTKDWLYQQIEEIKNHALEILELINK